MMETQYQVFCKIVNTQGNGNSDTIDGIPTVTRLIVEKQIVAQIVVVLQVQLFQVLR